jgi:hypothetical protein
MNNFAQFESIFLEQLRNDIVPLHDIVRDFMGFEKSYPQKVEIKAVLEFLSFIGEKYKVEILEGPELIPMKLSMNEFIDVFYKELETHGYENVHYRFWFRLNTPK